MVKLEALKIIHTSKCFIEYGFIEGNYDYGYFFIDFKSAVCSDKKTRKKYIDKIKTNYLQLGEW